MTPTDTTPADTLDSVMAGLTEDAVAKIADDTTKHLVESLQKEALGIATAYLTVGDPTQAILAETLKAANITLDDARHLVAEGLMLIALSVDRDARDLAAKKALTALEKARAHAHDQAMGYANSLRGKLGNKSPQLLSFGVKPLGGGHQGHPKAKTVDNKPK